MSSNTNNVNMSIHQVSKVACSDRIVECSWGEPYMVRTIRIFDHQGGVALELTLFTENGQTELPMITSKQGELAV